MTKFSFIIILLFFCIMKSSQEECSKDGEECSRDDKCCYNSFCVFEERKVKDSDKSCLDYNNGGYKNNRIKIKQQMYLDVFKCRPRPEIIWGKIDRNDYKDRSLRRGQTCQSALCSLPYKCNESKKSKDGNFINVCGEDDVLKKRKKNSNKWNDKECRNRHGK